jgi:hypothetical protein
MDAITLPEANLFYVVVGSGNAAGRLMDMAARLALRGPLLMLDCGNRSNPLPLVRALRCLTPNPVHSLGNIRTSRAFTCYQVVTLLEEVGFFPIQQPVIIFDLLSTFYDESVKYAESRRLLERSLSCIDHIRRAAPVLVSARPPLADFPERKGFIDLLCRRSDRYWAEEPPQPRSPQQLSFFD